jgi:hypothetical protein
MRLLNRCLLGAAVLIGASQARVAAATPLNLVLPEAPDILSQFIDINYDANTDALSVDGLSLQLSVAPGVNRDILNGTFHIGFQTDGTTVVGSGGDDLLIAGDVDLDGDSTIDISGPLLTGTIAQFGASTSGPGVFEFVFNVTGGILAPAFFGQGPAGVVLGASGGSTYTGSFAVDFTNLSGGQAGTGTASADTAPVPEPGTLLLLGTGVAGLVGYGRRERR